MTNVLSKKDDVDRLRKQQLMVYPPAIPYAKPKRKNPDFKEEKERFKSYDVKLNANDPDSPTVKYNCLVWE